MPVTDPYEVLGVAKDATPAEISAAYRAKAATLHPDVGGDEEAFARLGTAVMILRNPERRAKFDREGITDDRAANDPRGAAYSVIHAHFGAIVNEFVGSGFSPEKDPRRFDIFDRVLGLIMAEADQARAAIKIGKRHIEVLEDIGSRITRQERKGQMPDVLARAIADQITNSRTQLAGLEEQIEVRGMAIELLEDYDFRFDPPIEPDFTSVMGDPFRPGTYTFPR